MFQRYVRIQVDISPICKQGKKKKKYCECVSIIINYLCSSPLLIFVGDVADLLFAITFTLLSGNIRRFRRICEHIQSQICVKKYSTTTSHSENHPQATPTHHVINTSKSNCSKVSAESLHLSCGSADSNEKIYRERPTEIDGEVETFFDCNSTPTARRSSASSNKNSDDGSSC